MLYITCLHSRRGFSFSVPCRFALAASRVRAMGQMLTVQKAVLIIVRCSSVFFAVSNSFACNKLRSAITRSPALGAGAGRDQYPNLHGWLGLLIMGKASWWGGSH